MSTPHIIVKHRRYASAVDRLAYLLGPQSKSEKPPVGPRVGRYWSGGVTIGNGVETDAAFLMLDSMTFGRCQVIEFLVSQEELGGDPGVVEDVVDAMMAEFFPGIRWLAIRHSDRPHSHSHVLLVNDNLRGRSVQIDGPTFQRLRRAIATWTRGRAGASWGRGKEIERKLASLTDDEIIEQVRTGRLAVEKEENGHLDTLKWTLAFGGCAAVIRWWKLAGLLTSRARWLELNIRNGFRVFRQEEDRIRKRALARLREPEFAPTVDVPTPAPAAQQRTR